MKLFFFLLFFCQNIVIVTDNELPSQFLLSDLNSSWTDREGIYEEDYRYLEYIRLNIVENSIIVDFKDIKRLDKLRVPIIDKYPAFRLTEYGRFEYLPDDMIYESSYCMMELKNNIDLMYDVDIEYRYKRKRELAYKESDVRFEREIIAYIQYTGKPWVYINEDIEQFELDIEHYKREYGDDDFFPKWIDPKIPEKMILPHPWEEKYKYTAFPNMDLHNQLQDKKRKRSR